MLTKSYLAASHTALSSFIPAPMLLKPRAVALRMAFTGLLTTGFLGHAHAQTAPAIKREAAEDVRTLPAVTITGERSVGLPRPYAGGQVARGGRLGLLGDADVMKSPFSVSSYTSQMMQDQQAVTVADVLGKDSSVRSTGQTGGVVDSFFIRGFPIGEGNLGEIAFDGQYGVAPNYRVFSEYAERVEVIRGPAALLYGMSPNSGVGGVINIVPKRALVNDLTRFTADYTSNSQVGGHLDVSRRLGPDRQFGVRFNGSHHQGDTPVDNQSRRADVGALALDYQGERFRATLDLIRQEEKFDAPSRPFLVAAGIAVPSAPDGRRNVTQPWGWSKIDDQSALLRAEYDVSDKLTLFADVGGAHSDVARLSDQTPKILNSAGGTSATPMYFKFGVDRSTADAGVRAQFDTGAVHHAVTLQTSVYRDQLARGSNSGTAVLSNIYSPVASPIQGVSAPATVPKISETKLSGVALADTLSMLDERLQVTLGARLQQVKSDNFSPTSGAVTSSYDKSAVTPLLGVVVKPWQNVSFYANYIEALLPGETAPTRTSSGLPVTNAGTVFAPYRSKQKEIGVKYDGGSLGGSLSAFSTTQPQYFVQNGTFGANGEQRNQGVELNLFGEPVKGLRVLGGLTWLDAEQRRTANGATDGKTAIGVAKTQLTFSVSGTVDF